MINFDYYKKNKSILDQDKVFKLEREKNFSEIKNLMALIQNNIIESKLGSFSSFFTLETDKVNFFNPPNQNLDKNYELVFAGCSETNGCFISVDKNINYNKIWGFQISEMVKKEAVNLSQGGWGADTIVKNLIGFFGRNGNPKVLLVLFPDFSRLELPETRNFKPIRYKNSDFIGHQSLRNYVDDEKKCSVSHRPHKWKDIIDLTVPLWQFLQSILILEQYCKSSNIFLRYSSWDSQTNILLDTLKNNTDLYQSYVKLDSDDWINYTPNFYLECHKKLRTTYKEIFDMGHDGRHMGIHRHTHIAEGFIEEIEKNYTWS